MGYVIAAWILVILWILAPFLDYGIMRAKGYSRWDSWLFSWLSLLGLLVVWFLPDRS